MRYAVLRLHSSSSRGKKEEDAIEEEDLSHHTVTELKQKIKSLGGKIGNLNKAGLIEAYKNLLLLQKQQDDQQQQQQQSHSQQNVHIPTVQPVGVATTPFSSVVTSATATTTADGASSLWKKAESVLTAATNEVSVNQRNMIGRNAASCLGQDALPIASVDRVLAPPSLSNGNMSSENGTEKAARYPYGENRDRRLDSQMGDMELTFLGTASCLPTLTRGVSCTMMRYNGDCWMFDCGEATQVQVQCSRVKPSRVKKIFITHLHGDHLFGLPGILCLLGRSTIAERGMQEQEGETLPPIDIYGPEGIRNYIRASMQLTYSKITIPYRVHELKNIPYLHYGRPPSLNKLHTRLDPSYGERHGGRDIYPDQKGIYHVVDNEGELSVKAAPLQHSVPCIGYSITENDRLGSLKVDVIKDVVERNREALGKLPECKGNYLKIFAHLKTIPLDASYTFPDGTRVASSDVNFPPRKGRRVVILGDTCNPEPMGSISTEADVLVHEATNAWFPYEKTGFATYSQAERDTFIHGHSTPEMAGKFARQIKAKRLILTHFSPRYSGDSSLASMQTMWQIEDMARRTCQLREENSIIAAWDYMIYFVR
eukprot:gene9249-10212_t